MRRGGVRGAGKETEDSGPSPASISDLLFDPSATLDWIRSFLTIPSETGHVVPFIPTPQQILMVNGHTGRDITVKARQTRASSLIMARNVRRMTTNFGLNCVVIAQTDQITQLFRARIKHHLGDLRRAGLDFEIAYDNKEELVLGGLENRFIFASGEAKSGGVRGVQSAHIVHASEVAHWERDPGALIGGILPAVPPPPHGWTDFESTPNGADGFFFEYTQDALNRETLYEAHFYPWWLEPTYTIESYRGHRGTDIEELLRTFHPTKEESALMERHSLLPGQILWKRMKTKELLKTGQFFSQEYPEDINRCFLSASGAFFDDPTAARSHLEWYADLVRDPPWVYEELPYAQSVFPFYGPHLQVWLEPQPGRAYCMFMDCAAGFGNNEGEEDWTALVVLDVETCRHVATLRIKATPEQCGAMACAVGQFYNAALFGVERNGYGAGALNRARDLDYPNVYYYVDLDHPETKPQAGWYTTEKTRDMMLTKLRLAIFSRTLTTHDAVFVREAGAFTWQKKKQSGDRMWRAEARSGHDDMVMAMAGALMIRDRAWGGAGVGGSPLASPLERTMREAQDRVDDETVVYVGQHGIVLRKEKGRGKSTALPFMR